MEETTKKSLLDKWVWAVLAAIFANVLWGSASACIKLGYRAFAIGADAVMSQILFAGTRFFFAGVLALLFGSIARRRPLLPRRESAGMLLILALTQTVVQYTFFYMGLSKAPGYKGPIISASSVFFVILLSTLVFRQEKLSWRKLLGCLLGFAGVLVINLQSGGEHSFRLDGEGFLLLSSLSYAFSTVLLKRFTQREDPVTLCGWQFVLGGLVMMLTGLCFGGSLRPSGAGAWLLLGYLAFLSAAAYSIWSLLLRRYPPSRIAVFTFANPVFGVFLSAWILGESAELNLTRCLLALVLVGLGIWIVNRRAE